LKTDSDVLRSSSPLIPAELSDRDIARRQMKTRAFLKSRDERKRVEMRFALAIPLAIPTRIAAHAPSPAQGTSSLLALRFVAFRVKSAGRVSVLCKWRSGSPRRFRRTRFNSLGLQGFAVHDRLLFRAIVSIRSADSCCHGQFHSNCNPSDHPSRLGPLKKQ
jgi:hypothetical protein